MRRLIAAVAVALTWLVLLAEPAGAQDTGWEITSFAADLEVDAGGSLQVTERIDVDFGSLDKHGIYRVIPVRYELAPDTSVPDGDPADWRRVLDVHDVRVSSPTGAPADVELSGPGNQGTDLSIRIGDADVTVSGPQSYVIAYTVDGALNEFDGRAELFWNVTGDLWEVPMRSATAVVHAPVITQVACYTGYAGQSFPCETADRRSATEAVFASGGLDAGQALSVATRFEAGTVTVPPPVLERKWTLAQAMFGSPLAWPLAALTTLLGVAGVGALLLREGRDRVTRGPATAAGQVDVARSGERRRRLFEPRPVAVEFRPPDGLRPGQLGVIVDERVDPVDVSASIVDLAVRGYLTIEEEQTKVLWTTRSDWILRRSDEPTTDEGEPLPLLRFEKRLLDGVFEDGDEVRVSELKGDFASDYALVVGDLYDDTQRRKWFARRPDKVRSTWIGVGVAVLVAGVGLTILAAQTTRFAVAAIPIALAGLALLVGHRWMPRRTATGSAVLTRTLGFKEFIETADADRLRFAEAEGMFVPYLPYAVVFGATDRWARAFEDLGVDLGAAVGGWYVGHGTFNAMAFSSGLSDFSSAASSSLSTVPSSGGSGSGFSGGSVGGGFGGGGGGSW